MNRRMTSEMKERLIKLEELAINLAPDALTEVGWQGKHATPPVPENAPALYAAHREAIWGILLTEAEAAGAPSIWHWIADEYEPRVGGGADEFETTLLMWAVARILWAVSTPPFDGYSGRIYGSR